MKLKYSLLAILWPALGLHAQNPSVKPLTIGDKIPDNLVSEVINYKTPFVNLSDFKNKLIILDFWATWCTPCVAGMPGLSQLQKKFKNDIQVLPVNIGTYGDSKEAITKFFKQRKDIDLPSIYDSSLQLYSLFPHRLEPHSIIVDMQGTIKVIADGGYMTDANVTAILEGRPVDIPLKEDVLNWDSEKPLSQLQKATENLAYHSQFSHRVPGIVGIDKLDIGTDLYKTTVFNTDIPNLYLAALRRPFYYSKTRLVLENVSDPGLLSRPPSDDQSTNDKWDKANTFTYELIIPRKSKEREYQFMLEDLNRFFGALYGFKGQLAKRTVRCLAIVKKSSSARLSTKGGQAYSSTDNGIRSWYNTNFKDIIEVLNINMYKVSNLPIINATGYNGPVDMQLETGTHSLADLKKSLNTIGLDIIESKKEIEVLLITQHN